MAESKKTEKVTAKTEENVDVYIPRTRKDEGDVYVGINNSSWLIQRGVHVKVPKNVAKLLERSQRAREATYTD